MKSRLEINGKIIPFHGYKMTKIKETKTEKYSKRRLEELRSKINENQIFELMPDLSMYAVGSFGRDEGTKFSDIDVFFVDAASEEKVKVRSIKIFSEFLKICDDLDFPEVSKDGAFLEIIKLQDMLDQLGSPKDDHENYFTARMLLLLESKSIFNESAYNQIMDNVFKSYFRDYEKHEGNFHPTIIIHDIMRYWKTLCLNYEYKRNNDVDTHEEFELKADNLKLKFSRVLMCFGTLAAISANANNFSKEILLDICKKNPRERLIYACNNNESLNEKLNDTLELYDWFLCQVSKGKDSLVQKFQDERFQSEAKKKRQKFCSNIFDIIRILDNKNKALRLIVV